MFKSKKIIAVITVVIVVCSIFVMPVNADNIVTVRMPFSQPVITGSTTGYMEILVGDGAGYAGVVIGWTIQSDNFDDSDFVQITYDSSKGQFRFKPTTEYSGSFNYYLIRSDGSQTYYSDLITENYYTWFDVANVLNVHVYGNWQQHANLPLDSDYDFAFTYAEGIDTFYNMQSIINLLTSQGNTITDMAALLQSVREYTIYQNSNLEKIVKELQEGNSAILENQDQNSNEIQKNNDENTDKIIDNQNQLQQNEKDEALQSGEGSVDGVSGAIEDKSEGFIAALGNLIQTMSYTGTECAWSFPSIKLPAIEGVMPEYTLTEEKPIDFEFWVEKVPSQILLLIRSLLTIALIVYCFKELYSTISYVLTLKGGVDSE